MNQKHNFIVGVGVALVLGAGLTATPGWSQTTTATRGSQNSKDALVKQPGSLRSEPLDRFEGAIKMFERQDQTNPPPKNATVFVGSSTFTKWGSELESQFKEFKAINRGFGGSTIPESTHYANRIVINYKPARIIFYAGTNDVADGHSAQRVFDDFKLFCDKVHSSLPKTEIYFISISVAPSRARWEKTYDTANKLIEDYIRTTAYLHFIDVRSVMRDKQGKLREDLFIGDRLHMNAAGYALWTPIIREALAKRTDGYDTGSSMLPW